MLKFTNVVRLLKHDMVRYVPTTSIIGIKKKEEITNPLQNKKKNTNSIQRTCKLC